MTLEELWYAWCDVDDHTEVYLSFEGENKFDTFKFSERAKWRQYNRNIVKVFFATIQPNDRFIGGGGAFNKVTIILER